MSKCLPHEWKPSYNCDTYVFTDEESTHRIMNFSNNSRIQFSPANFIITMLNLIFTIICTTCIFSENTTSEIKHWIKKSFNYHCFATFQSDSNLGNTLGSKAGRDAVLAGIEFSDKNKIKCFIIRVYSNIWSTKMYVSETQLD